MNFNLTAKGSTRSAQSGFSLVELMIVVGIIGILSSIGLKQTKKVKCRALDTSGLACMKRMNDKVAIGKDEFDSPFECDAPIAKRCLPQDVNGDLVVNSDDADAMAAFLVAKTTKPYDAILPGYIYEVDGDKIPSTLDLALVVWCVTNASCPKSLSDI